jgi:site-specific DNA recombinase
MKKIEKEGKIIYAMYSRKSSEAEDRQALSIESQITENKKIASIHKIDVAESNMISESKSAKEPFGRLGFEELIKNTENKATQGIVAWHANRLSRNAIDTARLIDLFDRGLLREIVTQQQVFRNTPQDKFMLTLFCSQAKMENDNKSIDVKRGLQKKYEMGFPTGVSKIGYMNDGLEKSKKTIIADTKRFPLVKQLFEEYLTGNYSIRKILEYSEKTLCLKTIQRKKEGGKPIKLSRIYDILRDPFYAGFFYANDSNGTQIKYEVNKSVPRIITEEQYWKIQNMLGRKGRPCPSINKDMFPYVGRTTCENCGGSVTAENKHQIICDCKFKFPYKNKTNCPKCGIRIEDIKKPTYLHYIYYHCTKRKNPNCPEKSLQEKDINEHMAKYFEDHLQISPNLRDWCLKHLDELEKNEKQNEFEIRASWESEIQTKEKEYAELIKMKMKGLIDEEDFTKLKASIKADIKRAESELSTLGGSANISLERARKAFNLAVGIAEIFRNGSFEEKKEALSETGSNLTLKDKKLNVINDNVYSVIINGLLEAKEKNKAFEPEKYQVNKEKTEVFTSVIPTLLPG